MFRNPWQRFLNENFCTPDEVTGNRPCDSGRICDNCETKSAQELYVDFRKGLARKEHEPQARLDIQKGDRISVKAMGIVVTGLVHSASHYSLDFNREGKVEGGGWYIEIAKANMPGGVSYWKQGVDGGKVIEINGKRV